MSTAKDSILDFIEEAGKRFAKGLVAGGLDVGSVHTAKQALRVWQGDEVTTDKTETDEQLEKDYQNSPPVPFGRDTVRSVRP